VTPVVVSAAFHMTDKRTDEQRDGHRYRVKPRRKAPLLRRELNPLMGTGNYSATSNNMKLVHWPVMGGLLHLVQRGGDWAGPQPAQAPPRCTKCKSPPINGQHITVLLYIGPLLYGSNVPI